jgi:hypothetical protein
LNDAGLQQPVRRPAPLLVLLLFLAPFSGCLGGMEVTWGDGEGEYSTDFDIDGMSGTITNRLADTSARQFTDRPFDLRACDESNGTAFKLSGWLVQTKIFDQPVGEYASVTSWMIQDMNFEDAVDVEPGSVHVTIVSRDKDWSSPTQAYAMPPGKTDRKSFPHDDWILLGLIPASENVFEAALLMDANQPVEITGYLIIDQNGQFQSSPNHYGCHITTVDNGWSGQLVVTSIKYGIDERIVDADQKYIQGDIPFLGRSIYTILLLLSVVGAGAMFIFARNQLVLGADERAQAMLSDSQMRAGKSASHEAARHDARMEAQAEARRAEAEGVSRTTVAGAIPKFDIDSALAGDTPGATEHYVAGTTVSATEEADRMDDMVVDMQADLAIEQELQKKGLRGIISDLSEGGNGPGHKGSSSRSPEPAETKTLPARKTRKTRKTAKSEEEPEPEPKARKSAKTDGPDITDDDDFGDFSF